MRNARGTRLPPRGVIGLGAVVAVADVVQRDLVPVNLRPRELGHVGLPVAVVARLDREPPREHDSKTRHHDSHRAPAALNENERGQHCATINER